MITPQGHVSTLAGSGEKGHRDGDRFALAQFDCPHRVAMDANGHIVVAAKWNHCIRHVAAEGV
jgi:hypothetical protein